MASWKLQKERPLKGHSRLGGEEGPLQNNRYKSPEMWIYKTYGKNEKTQVSNYGSALDFVATLDTLLNLLYLNFIFCKMEVRLSD